MSLHQIVNLIHGSILPLSIPEFKISDKLLLRNVLGDGYMDTITIGTNSWHTIAYVGVESDYPMSEDFTNNQSKNFFSKASNYLDLFLLLYGLQYGKPYVKFLGSGTVIKKYSELGWHHASFPQFKTYTFEGEPLDSEREYASKLRDLFLLFESDIDNIVGSPLSISLRSYNNALLDYARWNLGLAIIQLFIAAEALVIIGNEPKRKNVSNRISCLISNDSQEGIALKRRIKQFYDLRSGIVHGGGKRASIKETQELFSIIKRSIFSRLSSNSLPKKEMIEILDQIVANWGNKNKLRDINSLDLTRYY